MSCRGLRPRSLRNIISSLLGHVNKFIQLTTYRLYVNLSLPDHEDGVAVLLALLDVLVGDQAAFGELDPRHSHGGSLRGGGYL